MNDAFKWMAKEMVYSSTPLDHLEQKLDLISFIASHKITKITMKERIL